MSYLIPEKETLEVEFKSDLKCLPDTELIDAVVAFANTSGGDLYLGVEDDGTVTGCHEKHRVLHGWQPLLPIGLCPRFLSV